jgi:hypothetical protein
MMEVVPEADEEAVRPEIPHTARTPRLSGKAPNSVLCRDGNYFGSLRRDQVVCERILKCVTRRKHHRVAHREREPSGAPVLPPQLRNGVIGRIAVRDQVLLSDNQTLA